MWTHYGPAALLGTWPDYRPHSGTILAHTGDLPTPKGPRPSRPDWGRFPVGAPEGGPALGRVIRSAAPTAFIIARLRLACKPPFTFFRLALSGPFPALCGVSLSSLTRGRALRARNGSALMPASRKRVTHHTRGPLLPPSPLYTLT